MKKLLLVLMLLGSATASQAEMNGDEIITRAPHIARAVRDARKTGESYPGRA